MKKHLPPFLAGALSVGIAASLLVSALADSGRISYSAANVTVFDYTIQSGDTYTGENGKEIPAAITYIDEDGDGTVYVSLRQMAELLDAPLYWDEETQTAVFGNGFAPSVPPTITVGDSSTQPPETYPSEPELGVKAGGFTEVAPVDRDALPDGFHYEPQEETHYSSLWGVNDKRFMVFEPYGNYVEITVTNHGAPVRFMVGRPYFAANGLYGERFTTVSLDTGETITRAFLMEPGTAFPRNYLRMDITPQDMSTAAATAAGGVDITYNIAQYRMDME